MLRRTRSTPSLEKPEDAPQNTKADTTTEPPILPEKKELSLEDQRRLRIFAGRLRDLYHLADDHGGAKEERERYQGELVKLGIENPPDNRLDAEALVKEVGEFHG